MLIIGAKGLAKEVLEIFHQRNELDNLFFYDDVSTDVPDKLYEQFTVLRNMEQVIELFKTDQRFVIAVGMPTVRFNLYNKFAAIGGQLVTAISPIAQVGNYGTTLAAGCIIMAGTVITNDVTIGMGCLINPNCSISHDTIIGDFAELSPGVKITGRCSVGNYCNIGTSATILPDTKLGNFVTVGAGAVVTKNVGEGLTVVGVPAKQINKQ